MVFIPIGDDDSDRRLTPWVNYALIALNVLVFVGPQRMGNDDKFTYAFATVPQEIVTGRDVVTPPRVVEDPVTGEKLEIPGLQRTPGTVYVTLLTSMFMHGGWMHLLGNMLFLWVFGDNVEDRLGHGRYVAFYLLGGIIASLIHVFTTVLFGGDPLVPCLGASGAISAVLAGYLWLFPHRSVWVLMLRIIMPVPAWVVIGVWFLFQLLNGMGVLGGDSQAGGGVAYAAHIGGFLAGLVLIFVMTPADERTRARR